jgi:hypothetical protein
MKTPIEQTRWRRWRASETLASRCASASAPLYRLAEYVGFAAIVETEWELGNFIAHAFINGDQINLFRDHLTDELRRELAGSRSLVNSLRAKSARTVWRASVMRQKTLLFADFHFVSIVVVASDGQAGLGTSRIL